MPTNTVIFVLPSTLIFGLDGAPSSMYMCETDRTLKSKYLKAIGQLINLSENMALYPK
jgi:hypothetical protein